MNTLITTTRSKVMSYNTTASFELEMPHINVTHFIESGNGNFVNPHSFCEPISSTPLIITAGFVGLLVVICNLLVVLAIAGGTAKFSRPMYWFIIQLSISDCLVGGMLLWNYCLAAILNIQNTMTSLTILQGFWVTSASASVLGIMLLAIDRYMQVVHRRMHKLYFNHLTVGLTIFLTWTGPLLGFLILPITFNWSCKENCSCIKGSYIECLPIEVCSQVIPPFTKRYALAVALFLYTIMPFPVMIYHLIYLKARKTTQQVRQKLRRRDLRLIRTLVVITVVFIITLAPCGVILIIDFTTTEHNTKLTDYALYIIMFASSNSLANPILYIWRIPVIRLSLQQKFKCCFKTNLQSDSRHSRFQLKSHISHNESPEKHHMKFMLCGRTLFTSNMSEDSQHSTPMVQHSGADKIFISEKGKPRKSPRLNLQTSTSEYVLSKRTPPPSPLCENLIIQTNRNKQISRRVRELSGSEVKHEETETFFPLLNKKPSLNIDVTIDAKPDQNQYIQNYASTSY